MSDFDVLGLLLIFAVLGAGVVLVLKFIASRLHHDDVSPYGPIKGRGDGDGSATSAGGPA